MSWVLQGFKQQFKQANLYKILHNCPLLHMDCTNWKTVVLTRTVAECCTGKFRTKALHLLVQPFLQASSERRHLRILVHPFLREHLVSYWQLEMMGGSLVRTPSTYLLFSPSPSQLDCLYLNRHR